jgi:hypothetical protein
MISRYNHIRAIACQSHNSEPFAEIAIDIKVNNLVSIKVMIKV